MSGTNDVKNTVLKKDSVPGKPIKTRVWEAFSLCEQFEIDLIVDVFNAKFISGYVK